MKIEIYPEVCCDGCLDTVHNHMDCPECKKHYADTDVFCSLYDEVKNGQLVITCGSCNTKFKTTHVENVDLYDDADWEKVTE